MPALSQLARELQAKLLELPSGASFQVPYLASDGPAVQAEVREAVEHAVAQLRGAGWDLDLDLAPDGPWITPKESPHG